MDDSPACHDQRALRARHLHRLSASSASLPPLAVLPPPISMGVPPPANIDLDVNFEAEIKPHLHACLVSTCCQQSIVTSQHGQKTELVLSPCYIIASESCIRRVGVKLQSRVRAGARRLWQCV